MRRCTHLPANLRHCCCRQWWLQISYFVFSLTLFFGIYVFIYLFILESLNGLKIEIAPLFNLKILCLFLD